MLELHERELDKLVGLPYLEGQANLEYGVDCLGLISLFYPQLNNPDIYSYSYNQGIHYLLSIGAEKTDNGNIGILRVRKDLYHLVIVYGDYVYHASKNRGCVVKDDYYIIKHLITERFAL